MALLERLKRDHPDWSPRGTLDIGANKGKWSRSANAIYPESGLILVEASNEWEKQLIKVATAIGNATSRIALLSERDGDTVNFYINPNAHTGNSMFKENTRFFESVEPVKRTAITVDTVVEEETRTLIDRGEAGPNFAIDLIKIDVQGAELAVLRGATETLAGATFVQLEAMTVEYNSGGSCAHEVDAFLRSQGFYLYDTADEIRNHRLFKTPALGQWDVLYVRPDSERLPRRLKESEPLFCGYGRGNPNVVGKESATDAIFLNVEPTSMLWMIIAWVLGVFSRPLLINKSLRNCRG